MRRARVGFWFSLVAVGAFGGAVTSVAAAWSETFRIEDLAVDLPATGDVDPFEHFRPDAGLFLNAFGWVLCAVMAVSVVVSASLAARRLRWWVAVLVGLAAGAAAALCAILCFLQVPAVAAIIGLGALAHAHAKGVVPSGGTEPVQPALLVRPRHHALLAVGAIVVLAVAILALWYLAGPI